LVSARDVCFGSLENGLPSSAGWLILILGPLSFLFAFTVAWPGELVHALRDLSQTSWRRHALYLVLAAVFVEATWVARKVNDGLAVKNFDFARKREDPLPETYPRTDIPAYDFTLTDQFGDQAGPKRFADETILLTFAFAHCQTVCPVLVRETLEAVKSLGGGVRILIVTLDPWRDTPKSLPGLAEKWELPARAHVLSGKVSEVMKVLKAYKVPYERDEKTGEVAHPALTYILSPGGRIAYTFNNTTSAWLIEAVRRIENGKDLASAGQAF
jgi:protein SCO1/2